MNNPHVLIVDDNPDIRSLCSTLIRAANFEVEECENGLEALRAIELREPCLILLDMAMPVMSGRRFMAEFAKRGYTNSPIPVYLFSANGDERTEKELGFQGSLPKPFLPHELLTLVRQHCKEQVTA